MPGDKSQQRPPSEYDIRLTSDMELIKAIITHEDIKDTLLRNAELDELRNPIIKNVGFYVFYLRKRIAGIAVFLDMSKELCRPDAYLVDVGIFKEFRRKHGAIFGKFMLSIFYRYKPNAKIYAIIDKTNRPSFYYAKYCGFVKKGSDNDNYYLEVDDNGRRR